jgi:hypothetical protein
MVMVYKAMTTAWPRGLAHLVIKAVFKKYSISHTPRYCDTQVKLRQMLNKIGMKKNADPATLFKQIARIKNCYNTMTSQIPQEELLAIILAPAPIEYNTELTTEQRA